MPVAWMAPASTLRLAGRLQGGTRRSGRAPACGQRRRRCRRRGPLGYPCVGGATASREPRLPRPGRSGIRAPAGRVGDCDLVAASPGRIPRTGVDLVRDPAVPLTWSRFKRLLLAHGIPGVPHLADLAMEAARQAGLDDPRVVVEGNRVEIALWTPGTWRSACSKSCGGGASTPRRSSSWSTGWRACPTAPLRSSTPTCGRRRSCWSTAAGGRRGPGCVALTGGTARLRQLLGRPAARAGAGGPSPRSSPGRAGPSPSRDSTSRTSASTRRCSPWPTGASA